MSFGFSTGDFVATGKLISDIISSLQSVGGAKSEYQEVIRELDSLNKTLQHLDRLGHDGTSSNVVDSIKFSALSCRVPLEDFLTKTRKYEKSLGPWSQPKALQAAAGKLGWAFRRKEDIGRMQTYLNMHIGTINILLMEHGLERMALNDKKAEERTVQNANKFVDNLNISFHDFLNREPSAHAFRDKNIKPTSPHDLEDSAVLSSDDEGSIFSIASLASSATDLSKASGFSPRQIATATRELLAIFCDNEVLQPLYTTAIHGKIGPRKFTNNFRRLLKIFSENVKEEAQDRLDYLAARLVALKASHIAEAIVEKSQVALVPTTSTRDDDVSSRNPGDSLSEDDEQQETGIDESIFDELTNFREFLVESTAFKEFQMSLQQFVYSPKVTLKKKIEQKPWLDRNITSNLSMHRRMSYNSEAIDKQIAEDIDKQLAEDILHDIIIEILEDDKLLLMIHWYAFVRLGGKDFIIEYADLLRLLCVNIENEVDSYPKVDMSSHIQTQSDWSRLAERIAKDIQMIGTKGLERDEDASMKALGLALDKILLISSNPLSHESKVNLSGDWKVITEMLVSSVPKILSGVSKMYLNLGLLTLSQSLRDIVLSSPKDLKISSVNSSSYVNKMKAVLETYTMLEWDWWPLSPRIPDVAPGQFRLEWMLGRTPLFQTISSVEVENIQVIMPLFPCHPHFCYCSHTVGEQTELSKTVWNSGAKHYADTMSSISGHSKASERYTPAGSNIGTSSQSSVQNTSATQSHKVLGDDNEASAQPQNPTNANPSTPHMESQRILFAIQGSKWSLGLEQIPISSSLDDPTFFRDLKVRHKQHRNWIKRIMSPFRFRFCRFVKFEKFDVERILSQGDDLPDYPGFKDDYEYAPRPGINPMITPKTFAVCLKICDVKCRWPWLNPWHDCVRLPCRPHKLLCIPKKKTEFDVRSNEIGTIAWGLEADYAVSFAFVVVYHLVPLFAALGFWIYWLIRFPDDWQNAAVPMLTVLALYAVLWTSFGRHVGTK